MTERQAKILDIISKNQKAEVVIISELMGVSQVTIRKDLDFLENRGFIKRQHGYACLDKTDEIGWRMAVNYDIKRRIAKAAAARVGDN